MDEVLRLILVYGAAPIIFGLGAFIMRSAFKRLEEIEKNVLTKLDEQRVRQLLADKIDPLREDVHDLKSQLDKIYTLLLKQ